MDAGGNVHAVRRVRPAFPRRSLTSPASTFHALGSGASSWNTERDGDSQDSCDDDDDDGGRCHKGQHRLPSPRGGKLRAMGKKDLGQGEERTTSNGGADKDRTSFLSSSPRGEWGEERPLPHARLEGVGGGPSPRHVSVKIYKTAVRA